MTSKPSRSEIENALSGRTNRSRAKTPQRPRNIDFDFEVSPRRQQVIGGDLTGVSKRPKYGIFSRYAEVSIANWIAGAIVLLIIGAFFWPQGGESIREVAERKAQQNNQSIYTESRIEEVDAPVVTPNPTFSRDTDIDRAAKFRDADEQQLKIRALLDSAERFVASGAYTQPSNDNAISVYKQVLEIEPKNVSAKQGMDKVNQILLTAGLSRLEKDQKTNAEKILTKLSVIDNKSEAYQELDEAIERWALERKIDGLLAKALKAQKAKQLTMPAKKNALYYFRQVLETDDQNEEALAGIDSIADRYIERTNEAMLKGQFITATSHLATVSEINPKHPSIPLLEALIIKAEPIVKQAEESASTKATSSDVETVASKQNASEKDSTTADVQNGNSTTGSTSDDTIASKGTPPTTVSANRTPSKEATEQAAFDKEYLRKGLDAYYKGDYSTAAALLKPLADKGISRAQFRIGYMHFLGRGFKKNRQEADRVIRAALPAIQKFANDGRTWAQSDLGSLHEDGLVLPRNYTEAVYWYRSAAEKGYPGAQTNLGIMYALGRGVNSNRRTAIEWFQRAAKQGDIVAKRNLEAMGLK